MVGAYVACKMKPFTSTDNVEDENTNAVRNSMEMSNTFSQRSTFLYQLLSHKKGFVVMLHHNLNSGSGNGNRASYIVETMKNNVSLLLVGIGMPQGTKIGSKQISFCAGDYLCFVLQFKGVQFLMHICFAITTTQVQGQSFQEKQRIHLRE